MNDVGVKLTQLRKQCGLTIGDAAEIIGVSRNPLAAYESGKTEIPITVCMRLMNLYNCDVFDIYGVHADDENKSDFCQILKIQAGCEVLKEIEADKRLGMTEISDEYYKKKFKLYVKRYTDDTRFMGQITDEEIDRTADILFGALNNT